MYEAVVGFALGFALVLIGVLLGKARGVVKDWTRNAAALERRLLELEAGLAGNRSVYQDMREQLDAIGGGASDAAIAMLAGRISAMEKQLAAQDMTILDTAEKVTNRLQDRLRKRREAEVPAEDHDEAPNDPNVLLMRARAFYNQPQLPFGEENAG